MREIKFRAWDKLECQMTVTETLERLMSQDSIPESWVNDMVFMQFTGLKDKNGAEIYEGDVLQGEWGEQCSELKKDKFVAKVIFINGCFRLDWWMKRLTLESAATGIFWREYMRSSPDMFYETSPLEVIGNIYENPDLLKELS